MVAVVGERDGHGLSVDDDARVWDAREMAVVRRDAWVDGWNEALRVVRGRHEMRGGRGAGMGGGEGDDLRRLVGERFANALEGVWLASLRYLRGTVGDENGGLRGAVGSGRIRRPEGLTDRRLVIGGARGGARNGGVGRGGVNEGGLVVDEAALAFKARVERQIRKTTREMEAWLENRSSLRKGNDALRARKCVRCRRYAEEKWMFCPFDGAEVK